MADGNRGEPLEGEFLSGFAGAAGLCDAIVARVAAGENLAAICREEGMPCRTTVHAWAQASAGFGEALREAFRQARVARRLADWRRARELAGRPGPKRRPLLYSPKLGETICERLAEGRSLSSIVADPDMPSYRSVMNWARLIPEFGNMYAEARQIQADYFFDEARDVAQAATPAGVWVSRLQFDVIRWQTARLSPRKYCERLVVVQGQVAVKAEAAEADGVAGPMTVIVKRFSDVTDAEVAQAEAHEARLIARGR